VRVRHSIRTYGGGEGIASRILFLGTRWRVSGQIHAPAAFPPAHRSHMYTEQHTHISHQITPLSAGCFELEDVLDLVHVQQRQGRSTALHNILYSKCVATEP